jgi:anti-sigma B factor antagonist
MQITSTEYKHCDLIKVTGRIDSSNASQLGDAIGAILKHGRYKLVLDMSELEFISSAGLRVLVNTQKTSRQFDRGDVLLAAVPKNIYAALDLAGFTALFDVYPDVVGAMGNI